MKQSKTNERRRAFLAAIEAAGIDTNTDFFALSFSDLATLADSHPQRDGGQTARPADDPPLHEFFTPV